MSRWRVDAVIATGLILAVVGIVISLLVTAPEDAGANTSAWLKLVFNNSVFWTCVLCGLGAFTIGYGLSRRRSPAVIDFERAKKEFKAALSTNESERAVCVCGYTGEVFLRDFAEFGALEDRRNTFRLLLRNWLDEQDDQTKHNIALARQNREWDKADKIREIATQKWSYPSSLEVRCYSHHPLLKATMLVVEHKPVVGLLSLHEWQESPPTGGSQFKGHDGLVYVRLRSWRKREDKLLKVLYSQFKYEWLNAPTAADVLTLEAGTQ